MTDARVSTNTDESTLCLAILLYSVINKLQNLKTEKFWGKKNSHCNEDIAVCARECDCMSYIYIGKKRNDSLVHMK